jgi:hypothetical protein
VVLEALTTENKLTNYLKKELEKEKIFKNLDEISNSSRKYCFECIKLENMCLFCKGDIVGNSKYGFYCKNCNIIYSWKDIIKTIPMLIL